MAKALELETRSSLLSSENRILVVVIITISMVLFVMGWFITSRYQEQLDENYEHFGSLIASVVAIGGAEKLASPVQPELKLQTFAEEMLSVSQDVAVISFYDNNGNLLKQSRRSEATDAEVAQAMDFSAPILLHHGTANNQALGVVHVKLTGKTLKNIAVATKTLVSLVFLSAWLISILAVSLNTYILSKHLRTLVRGVKRLSTGDFGYRISENDLWGELRLLAESFNDMSLRLRAYEDQNVDTITFERNKLEAVLLSIADGVIVCDPSGKAIIINHSACRMLGVKDSHLLVGEPMQQYTALDGQRCFKPLIDEFGQEWQNRRYNPADPFSRAVEMPGISLKVMISPIFDTEGQNLGFVMIMHDVTKEMEVDKLKTHFISNVSHELRTPVTTIKSYVDTLYNHGKDLDAETYQEFMETINTETDRLKKLVNDILDFSRLQEGSIRLEMETQDISPIINLTVQSVKVLAQQKNINLSTAVESNLPPVYLNSDGIERVLRNLLSNAIKYTPDGGRIKCRAELAENGEAIEVTVQDTGIGIPKEHLPYIFDRFYRVENKVHTVKGTGLGLHLVKVMIEDHHHGVVLVRSEVGVGSTFGFRLPLIPPQEEDQKHIV